MKSAKDVRKDTRSYKLLSTHNAQSADNLFRWLYTRTDNIGDKVRCYADDSDHGDKGKSSNDEKGLAERQSSIAWDGRHVDVGKVLVLSMWSSK